MTVLTNNHHWCYRVELGQEISFNQVSFTKSVGLYAETMVHFCNCIPCIFHFEWKKYWPLHTPPHPLSQLKKNFKWTLDTIWVSIESNIKFWWIFVLELTLTQKYTHNWKNTKWNGLEGKMTISYKAVCSGIVMFSMKSFHTNFQKIIICKVI